MKYAGPMDLDVGRRKQARKLPRWLPLRKLADAHLELPPNTVAPAVLIDIKKKKLHD